MQQLIEKMVTDFERGKLSRRQLASALAGLEFAIDESSIAGKLGAVIEFAAKPPVASVV